MKHQFAVLLLFLTACLTAGAQAFRIDPTMPNNGTQNGTDGLNSQFDATSGSYEDGAGRRTTWGRDTTKTKQDKPIPIGLFHWTVEPRLGNIQDAENNDTVVHNFQSYNITDGYKGEYNILGNLASPRLCRNWFSRQESADDFLFLQPYSFFRGSLSDFRYTNTKSPITNLAYHSCGNDQTGEDRFRAYFATNINKQAGIGFKFDYSYGRGYYNNSANALFGSTFYGYYRGERYSMHAYAGVNHLKMAENGGIEDDLYITNPQSFQQSYNSEDIPTNLSETWNRNHEQHFFLAQRYNLGFYRDIEVPDSLKPHEPSHSELLSHLSDSLQTVLRTDSVARRLAIDSLMQDWRSKQVIPRDFIPVTSLTHTFELQNLKHEYLSHQTPTDYYTNHYYGDWNDVDDETRALSVRNTLGLAMREGFNKWAQFGITLFATHRLRSYRLMTTVQDEQEKVNENDLSVGANLLRTQGRSLHFDATGEVWLVGEHVGDLSIDGKTGLEFRLGKRDSLLIDLHAAYQHQKPTFFFRHYHSQSSWWDNTGLSREVRFKVDGNLRLKKLGTSLRIGVENVSNYTYFGMENTLKAGADPLTVKPGDFTHAVAVRQQSGSVQVFGATLAQDLKFGPFHWDTEATYQTSSNQEVLPLPQVSVYTNVYFLFRIAKVLRVQLGGDMRYFTDYYAPDYSPSVQQFAVQDARYERIRIGNYPILSAYANLHLKHCRLYVVGQHLNANNGFAFWAPHYPINPMNIRFGVSWNFFN